MENSQNIDFRQYVEVVLRRKYLALSVCLTVLSLFTWGSFFMPQIYSASSTVLIEKNSIIGPLIGGLAISSGNDGSLGSFRNSAISRSIIERVAKKLGQTDIDGIRKNLFINAQTSRESGSDLFTVSYQGGNPVQVRDVVNTFVQECIDETRGTRQTDVSGAHDFIQGQLMEYKRKLEDSDKAAREFRENNPNMVPRSENSLIGRIENYQTLKIESEIRLKELTRKRENLKMQLSGEKELAVSMVTNEGSPQGRLNYLNNQIVVLMTRYTDSYPEVIRIKSEIEELKRQIAQAKISQAQPSGYETVTMNPIYQQLREDLARTDAEVESIRARGDEILRQQHEGERVLGRMPKEQEEWTKLMRNRNVYQKIYDDFLMKLETAKVSQDLEGKNKVGSFKIIEAATVPRLPIKPNRVMMILAGLGLGIASGVGFVLALDYLNNSFKNVEAIESKLKLTVLATIPKVVTEKDKLYSKKLDKQVFTVAGIYLMAICLVFVHELLYQYMGIRVVNF